MKGVTEGEAAVPGHVFCQAKGVQVARFMGGRLLGCGLVLGGGLLGGAWGPPEDSSVADGLGGLGDVGGEGRGGDLVPQHRRTSVTDPLGSHRT